MSDAAFAVLALSFEDFPSEPWEGDDVIAGALTLSASPFLLDDFSSILAAAFSSRSTFSFFGAASVGAHSLKTSFGESFGESFETGTALEATSLSTLGLGLGLVLVLAADSFSAGVPGRPSDFTAAAAAAGGGGAAGSEFFAFGTVAPAGVVAADSPAAASLTIALSPSTSRFVASSTSPDGASTATVSTADDDSLLDDSLLTDFATAAAAALVLATSATGLGASDEVVAVS
mmetsp:Transcript_1965/g.7643  ORF Transcript_1965/g.7643 Transcript_1965/m.7643 type:complete len:232 (-) Transcript_1965:283-978(-)